MRKWSEEDDRYGRELVVIRTKLAHQVCLLDRMSPVLGSVKGNKECCVMLTHSVMF